mgnify:CR=1 FL=1
MQKVVITHTSPKLVLFGVLIPTNIKVLRVGFGNLFLTLLTLSD